MTGKVKEWDAAKGFGFIERQPGMRRDIFVHHSDIVSELPGRRNLEPGQFVSFDVTENEKGPRALRVSVVE